MSDGPPAILRSRIESAPAGRTADRGLGTRAGLLLALAVVGVACWRQPPRLGDLDDIRVSGTLRVAVRPGFGTRPIPVTGAASEAALLSQLAARLGVGLELVRARRADQLLDLVERGRADIAVGRLAPIAVDRETLIATAAVDWVDDLIVAAPGSGIEGLDGIAGRPLHLQRSRARWMIPDGLLAPGRGPRLVPVPEEVPLETVLERVRGGRYALTVADSAVVDAVRRPDGLRILAPAAERRAVVWVVRTANPRLLAAVNDFLFAEQVLLRTSQTLDCRDLEEIRALGVLRLVTRNSPTTCTVDRGGLEGFEYDLAVSFGRSLGVRLELAMPPPGVEPLDWLATGYGDLAALHEPLPLERAGHFPATRPYRWVDLIAVHADHREPPAGVHELGGRRVAAGTAIASWLQELPIEPPPDLLTLRPGADSLTALSAVVRGEAEIAVVDEDTAILELEENRAGLVPGPVVLPGVPLVWVTSPSGRELAKRADLFLRGARSSGLIRQLALSELRPGRRWAPRHLPDVPTGALTPFDDLLKAAARDQGLDWRLMASLMYEESRFDPDASGPGGSAGLFQFMPATWRELEVADPHDPEQAVRGAAAYLRRMMDQFPDLEISDRVAMAIASYNVGPRHLFDARALAGQMGLDPDRWTGNVENALVLLDDPEVARTFPAGVCRCRRAAFYTRRILRRYLAYAEQFPPS